MRPRKRLQVVVETPEYLKQAETCMDTENRREFVNYIAENPLEGAVIAGTGGARKIRWASNSQSGKSGGARIIYYYHHEDMPIFLFTAYGKSQRSNISDAECKLLKSIISKLVKAYEEK